MKKSTWLLMVVLVLTVSGIKTSHAYSKNMHAAKEELNVKIIPIKSEEKSMARSDDSKSTSVSESKNDKTNMTTKDESTTTSEMEQHTETIESLPLPEMDDPIDSMTIQETFNETVIEEPIKKNFSKKGRNTDFLQDFSNGFNYLGYHYEIGHFSGFDYLPAWTNIVYQWTNFPSHYLIEYQSYPGQTIFGLEIGSSVFIDGIELHVYDILYNQPNDQLALENVIYSEAVASIQVCVSTKDDSELNLYFLR